jgi:hypothetical protein
MALNLSGLFSDSDDNKRMICDRNLGGSKWGRLMLGLVYRSEQISGIVV